MNEQFGDGYTEEKQMVSGSASSGGSLNIFAAAFKCFKVTFKRLLSAIDA